MIYQMEHHFILFSLIFLVIGYLLGNELRNTKKNLIDEEAESFFKKEKRKSKQDKMEKSPIINIDESTHVIKIKTDGLEKKYDEIGKNKTTQEDISSSVNKLKNLKK